jgi:hypothetical protein
LEIVRENHIAREDTANIPTGERYVWLRFSLDLKTLVVILHQRCRHCGWETKARNHTHCRSGRCVWNPMLEIIGREALKPQEGGGS